MRWRLDCRCWWYRLISFAFLRLAPLCSSYQVALVFVDARGVVGGVEVGLQRVVGLDGVGARRRRVLVGGGHAGRQYLMRGEALLTTAKEEGRICLVGRNAHASEARSDTGREKVR